MHNAVQADRIFGDPGLSPEQNERLLSRLVYSGRVRLEKSPGEPLAVEELRAWVAKRGLPSGYLPHIGISVDDVLAELRRPRGALFLYHTLPIARHGNRMDRL